MKVTEEFIRNAEYCYLRGGNALYVVGSWDDEFMFIAGTGDKKWTAWETDRFFDSWNDGIYLYNPIGAEVALKFVRENGISEDVDE